MALTSSTTAVRVNMTNRFKKVPFDKLVGSIVALGVPGLVLLIAMAVSGWAGAAALTTALAALGGPVGMLGGVALLGVLGLISYGISQYGFEKIVIAVIKQLRKQGRKKEDVIRQVQSYPMSRGMKLKIVDTLNAAWPKIVEA
jgi:hypothetical protein